MLKCPLTFRKSPSDPGKLITDRMAGLGVALVSEGGAAL